MDKMDKVFQKFSDTDHKMYTMNGLMIAQIICQRRFMDAFDSKATPSDIVSSIMSDIADAMATIQLPD